MWHRYTCTLFINMYLVHEEDVHLCYNFQTALHFASASSFKFSNYDHHTDNDWLFNHIEMNLWNKEPNNILANRIQPVRHVRFCSKQIHVHMYSTLQEVQKNLFESVTLHVSIIKTNIFYTIHVNRNLILSLYDYPSTFIKYSRTILPIAKWIRWVGVSVGFLFDL